MKPILQQRLGQNLTLTPQLRQAIKLLQLSSMELELELNLALESNPLLDLDEEERQFIREQMAAPIDAQALAREVPQGLGPQVYLVSVMAIDFDSQEEAQYLHKLAQALGLEPQMVNRIHQEVGVQNLYS